MIMDEIFLIIYFQNMDCLFCYTGCCIRYIYALLL